MAPPLPLRPLSIPFPNARGNPDAQGRFLTIQVFNDLICPFSRRITLRLIEIGHKLASTRPVEFVNEPMPQPWHPQSPILHEAALGVRVLEGDEGYMKFVEHVLAEENYAKFQDIEAYDKTRTQMHNELADIYAAVFNKPKSALLDLLKYTPEEPGARNSGNVMTSQLKLHIKYARRMGVHVSPTVFVNGIEVVQVSSGWTQEQWEEFLDGQLAVA